MSQPYPIEIVLPPVNRPVLRNNIDMIELSLVNVFHNARNSTTIRQTLETLNKPFRYSAQPLRYSWWM